MGEKTHNTRSPSQGLRILNCPGSVERAQRHLEKHGSPPESDYSAEGTQFHDLLEEMMTSEDALEHVNLDSTKEKYPEDMRQHALRWANEIETLRMLGMSLERVEEKIESKKYSDFGGTSDYWCYFGDSDPAILHVWDAKYGAGIDVDVTENVQLGLYAILIIDEYELEPDEIVFTIYQPRVGDGEPKVWHCPLDWLEDLRMLFEQSLQEKAIKPGGWCRWCPVLRDCPEYRETLTQMAETTFDHLASPEEVAEWERMYEMRTTISQFFKDLERALVHEASQNGADLQLYEVQDALGNTRWVQSMTEQELITRIAGRTKDKKRIGRKNITESRLKSPTKLKDQGYGEAIKDLIERPLNGLRLSKRKKGKPKMSPTPAASEIFEDQSDGPSIDDLIG